MSSGGRNNFMDESSAKPALPGMEGGGGGKVGKTLNSQALVLVIILSVSACALIAMRKLGLKAGLDMTSIATADPVSFNRDDPEKMARYERIMSDLQRIQAPLDMSQGELAKIPLLLEPGAGGTAAAPQDTEEAIAARQKAIEERKRNERLARLKDQLNKLKLQSVVGGKMPVARISGETVKVGDKVGDGYVVKAIHDRSVELEIEGETFTLDMGVSKSMTTPRTKK